MEQAVKVRSLIEVLQWSREFHRLLFESLHHCASQHGNDSIRLVLDYLAEHESTLHRVLSEFESTTAPALLIRACEAYLTRRPLLALPQCDQPFSGMTSLEIMAAVMEQHKQVIELYRHLYDSADTPDTRDLLGELVALEEHEAMRMAQNVNRLQDY